MFSIIVWLVSTALAHVYGPEASYKAIWDAYVEGVDSNFGRKLLLHFIVAPFADITERIRIPPPQNTSLSSMSLMADIRDLSGSGPHP